MREHPTVPERAGVRTGDPFYWPLTYEDASALLAEVEAEGWLIGEPSPLAIRVDGQLWQKDGYSPCRWGWAFSVRLPLIRDTWTNRYIYSAAERFYWCSTPFMQAARQRSAPDARLAARQWHRARRAAA